MARTWMLGIFSTLLGVLGQLLFRRFGQAQAGSGWPFVELFVVPDGVGYLIAGVICYLVAVLSWISVLRKVPLSRAFPLACLSYPLVYLGAVVWLDEPMSTARTLGTALVTAGALLAAAPSGEQSVSKR